MSTEPNQPSSNAVVRACVPDTQVADVVLFDDNYRPAIRRLVGALSGRGALPVYS